MSLLDNLRQAVKNDPKTKKPSQIKRLLAKDEIRNDIITLSKEGVSNIGIARALNATLGTKLVSEEITVSKTLFKENFPEDAKDNGKTITYSRVPQFDANDIKKVIGWTEPVLELTKTEEKLFESIQEGIALEQELDFLIQEGIVDELNYFLNLSKTKQYQIIKEQKNNKVTREEYISELYPDYKYFINLRKRVKLRETLDKKKTPLRIAKEAQVQEKVDRICGSADPLDYYEPSEPLDFSFLDT